MEIKCYTFRLHYVDPPADPHGVAFDAAVQELLTTDAARDYAEGYRLVAERESGLARAYSGLSFVRSHPSYTPPAAATFEDPRAEVDRRVRARIHEEGGDATKDYKKALDAVLAADADLKTAYAGS